MIQSRHDAAHDQETDAEAHVQCRNGCSGERSVPWNIDAAFRRLTKLARADVRHKDALSHSTPVALAPSPCSLRSRFGAFAA